jgi:hypothetical protein
MVSFALGSSDNRTFREAIDAVARAVDEAIIQPTEDTLEIRAVDAANVFSVEAIIPLGAFDRSSAIAGGAFGVDVDGLSSTLGNINKTSGILLEDGVDDAFTVTDRSTGDTTEFEIKDPESMRDPPDLAGSVKMMDYDASASVPRNQFRRVVRAAGSVGDTVGVGVGPQDGASGPMAFKMVCEGDTDTLTGSPDFEFDTATPPNESAAGLYNHDYLDRVSLGVPARGIDVNIALNGDDAPLRVAFETGGDVPAQVTYHVAPRIGSGATEAGQLVKSADVTGAPVASPDFIVSMGGQQADTFVDALSAVADERRVMFTRRGVESRVVDAASVIMSIIQAQPGFFDTYNEVDGFPADPVGVPTRRLAKYYSEWLSSQKLTLSYDSETRFMGLTHPIFSIEMGAIDPDAMRQEPNIPTNLTFDATADVEQSELSQAVGSLSTSAGGDDNAEIGVVITADAAASSGMYLTDQDGGRRQVSGGSQVRGNALGLFSGDYMENMADALITQSDTPASVRLGNSLPMTVRAPNDAGTFSHMTLLAPRVKDSKAEVLDAPAIADGMSGAAVDLSFYTDDTGSAEVGFFEDISEESPAERARKGAIPVVPRHGRSEHGVQRRQHPHRERRRPGGR